MRLHKIIESIDGTDDSYNQKDSNDITVKPRIELPKGQVIFLANNINDDGLFMDGKLISNYDAWDIIWSQRHDIFIYSDHIKLDLEKYIRLKLETPLRYSSVVDKYKINYCKNFLKALNHNPDACPDALKVFWVDQFLLGYEDNSAAVDRYGKALIVGISHKDLKNFRHHKRSIHQIFSI